jgi:hypothetical protein
MVRSRSEYYTSMSVSGLPTFLISVKFCIKKKKKLTGYIQYYKKMVGQTQSPWVRQNPSSCLTQCQTEKTSIANNLYLMIRSRSEYYTSMSVSGLPTFLISVKNMNLLSSSIYKHLKTYLIKHKT